MPAGAHGLLLIGYTAMSLPFVSVPSEHSQHHGQGIPQRPVKAGYTFAEHLQNQCLSVMILSPFSASVHTAPLPTLPQPLLPVHRSVRTDSPATDIYHLLFLLLGLLRLSQLSGLWFYATFSPAIGAPCHPPLLPSLLRTPYHSSTLLHGVVCNHLSTLAGKLALGSNTIMSPELDGGRVCRRAVE